MCYEIIRNICSLCFFLLRFYSIDQTKQYTVHITNTKTLQFVIILYFFGVTDKSEFKFSTCYLEQFVFSR